MTGSEERDGRAALTRRQAVFDVGLGVALTSLVLPISVSGSEAVPANVPPGPTLVVLTVLAVAPVVVRRRFPLAVLVVTLAAALALVVTRNVVAFATLGPLVASYTAVAHASRRQARAATAVLLAGLALTAVLQPVDLSVEGAVVQAVVFVGGWLLATAARERRELFAAGLDRARHEAARERERADAERERARRLASEERLRISREVHDVVGHALSVVVVQAGVAEQLVSERPDEARRAVADIARVGRESLAEIRELLGLLRTGDVDDPGDGTGPATGGLPSLDDLPALVERSRAAGLDVTVRRSGPVAALEPGVGLAAYRVVQEALTNSLRHAHARSAEVTLAYAPDRLDVGVVDDGRGPAGDAEPAAGHGLDGMRERVMIYGGTFRAGPAPGRGFAVSARFPLRTAAATGAGSAATPAGRDPAVLP